MFVLPPKEMFIFKAVVLVPSRCTLSESGASLQVHAGANSGAHYLKVEPHFKSKKPNLLQLLGQQVQRLLGGKQEAAEPETQS